MTYTPFVLIYLQHNSKTFNLGLKRDKDIKKGDPCNDRERISKKASVTSTLKQYKIISVASK